MINSIKQLNYRNLKAKLTLLGIVFLLAFAQSYGADYYSFASGDWSVSTNWTSDPTGITQVGSGTPGASDNAFIINNKTITTSIARTVTSMTINPGATLDLGSTAGNNLGTLSGGGTLRINSLTLPSGTLTAFLGTSGGTVDFYNISGNLPNNLTYRNLKISNSTGSNHTVHIPNPSNPTTYNISGNFTLSNTGGGNLTVRTGTAITNSIQFNISGDVNISDDCTWNAGFFNAFHNVTCSGNFTNNGTVDFSNSVQFAPALAGAVNLTFNGSANKIFTCNSTTEVYELIINKGTDASSILRLLSDNNNNFKLFSPGNALQLVNGTLRIGDNNTINRVNAGGLFTIPSTCRLWIDGATMTINGNSSGVQADGIFRISNGTFSIGNEGLITGLNGQLIFEGGTNTVEKIRPVINAGTHTSTFSMSSGTLNVDGSTSGSGDSQFPRFCIPYTTQGFYLTGGTINISNPETGTAVNGGILIGVSNTNYNVTNGTCNITIPASATNFNIISTAPLYTVNISKAGAGTGKATMYPQTIGAGISLGSPISPVAFAVNRDLNLVTGNSPEFDANGTDVSIGRNFVIQNGTTYTPLANTTTFNGGNFSQYLTVNGTISGGLYNLVVSKPLFSTLFINGSITSINVLNDLSVLVGTLGASRKVLVTGDIYNTGSVTGTSGITMVGTGAQEIGGNGNGKITVLILDKASGTTTLTASMQIDGELRLAGTAGILDITNQTLNFRETAYAYFGLSGTSTAFNNTHMVRTNGLGSNGGIRKRYNSSNKKFLYPLGSASKYTPAYFEVTGNATTYGFVSIRPVNNAHPILTASACALNYYWKTTSTGFNLGTADVIHKYTYDQSDVVTGVGVSESDYLGGFYDPFQVKWKKTDASFVDEVNNVITFDNTYTSQVIDGEFTCGDDDPNDPFSNVIAFYSIQNGDWSDVNLATTPWSVQGFGGPPAGITPGPDNPVLIGDGSGNFHTITVNSNGQKCGNLILSSGSVLDVGTSTGHNFSVFNGIGITGSGRVRVSSSSPTAIFPGGDWGLFILSTGGTVEYYTGSVDFTLPTQIFQGVPSPISLDTYRLLVFTTGTGRTITLPNIDLTVLQTTTCTGTGTVKANSVNSHALNFTGSLNVQGGTFLLPMGGTAQTLNFSANLNISAGATFTVANTGTAVTHQIFTTANISNNGTLNLNETGNRTCDLNWTGSGGNRTFSGTNGGAVTKVGKMTVNRGINQVPELNVDVQGSFTAPDENWLYLVNGTLKFSRAYTLDLSETNNFIIPATSRLWLNHSGLVMNACIGNTDNADVLLAGKLQIDAGTFNVGTSTNNNNNDIEYSSISTPEIQLNGGLLFVNGQIRRNASLFTGDLIYKQAGTSQVIINGRNAIITRAKLEVLNPSSYFEMKDNSVLRIVRGGGTVFSDLYIQSVNALITGGTVQFMPGNAGADQTYRVECTTPLYNVLIDGNTTNDEATLQLEQSFIINGNLTINDNFSVLNANGFDLLLRGNMTNSNTNSSSSLTSGGFRSATSTQTTTFGSATSSQTLTGVAGNRTNFANLVLNNIFPSGSLTMAANTNVTVHNILTLTEGTLNDGGNTIVTLSDINNSSVHASSGAGKILCQGPVKQFIGGDGSGVFGKIEIDNSAGVSTTANHRITNNLTLTNGSLFIDYFSLRLLNSCTVSGSFSGSKMIQTQGALGDSGVIKYFNAGAATFSFPVGVDVNYTPADFNITSNTAPGTIRVAPVKTKHPATTDPADKQLNLFWVVRESGFSGLNVTHTYHYLDSYVTGTESNYVGGRYILPQWNPMGGIPGAVNTTANTITISGNFIIGDYTAGETSEFQPIDTLYSRNATLGGNWNDINTWSVSGHGGPAAGITPTFEIVKIAVGHSVNIVQDGETCSVLDNQGQLDVADHTLIVFGYGLGTGLMKITSNSGTFNFPTGDFSFFHSSTGGTVEYYGALNGNLSAQPFYNNLRFTDNSTKVMGSVNCTINGDFTIQGGVVDNSAHNKTIDLKKNWVNNVNSSAFVPGTSTIRFSGANQSIGGSSLSTFNNVEIIGTGVKSLDKPVVINKNLLINSTLDATVLNSPIDIKGNFTNNGTFEEREGLVTFNGSNLQEIGGTTQTDFFDITVNNIFGTKMTSNQSHNNNLTVQLGTYDTDLYTHTLNSTLTRTARIAALTSGDITGQFTMQRLAPGPLTGWACLGTPITNAKLNQWTDDFPTSGFTGSTGSAGNFISVNTYNESDLSAFSAPTSYAPATNAAIDPLSHTVGFWVYLGTGQVNTNNIMIDVTGNMFKGSVSFNPSFSSSGSLADDGWNLVANPYPSAIDWNSPSWTKTNIDDAVYIWQADLNGYATYVGGVGTFGGTNIINSSQGFFVKANNSGPQLQANENIKATGNPPFLRSGQSPGTSDVIRMKLNDASGLYDEAVLRFNDNSTEGFDGKYDAYKLFSPAGHVPGIALSSANSDFAINTLPYTAVINIPVKVKGIPGSYSLKFEGLNNLPGESCLVLEDLLTGTKTDLRQVNTVNFNVSNSDYNVRFLIHITHSLPVVSTPATCSSSNDGTIQVINDGSALNWTADLKNSNGEVKNSKAVNATETSFEGLNSGVYTITYSNSSLCGNFEATTEVPALYHPNADFTIESIQTSNAGTQVKFVPAVNGDFKWTFGDGSTELSNGPITHIYTSKGSFNVSCENNESGCYAIKETILETGNLTASGEITLGKGINEIVAYLNIPVGTQIQVSVYNSIGQEVIQTQKEVSGSPIHLDFSGLSQGSYLLNFKYNNQESNHKVTW